MPCCEPSPRHLVRRDATRCSWLGSVALVAALVGSAIAGSGTALAQARVALDSLGNPAPPKPDTALTPGATLPVTVQDICTPGYSRKVRSVPAQVKRDVYRQYAVASHVAGEYEVDHLISLELGGSNSERNLWPQSYWTSPWNAHVKDKLENALHREVCAGRLPLDVAQHAIATDWIAAYRKYVKPSRKKETLWPRTRS
jgi:hypothetical protein